MSTPVENTPVEEKDKIIKKWKIVRSAGGYKWIGILFGSGASVLLARGCSFLGDFFRKEDEEELGTFFTKASPVLLVIAGALLIGAICAIVLFIMNKRMKNLPVVLEYEQKLKTEREEREKKEREEKLAPLRARYRSFKEANAKHTLIVCATAHFNGHYDSDGYRQVFVDGSPYGSATPWAVLGLPGGSHSVFVRYMERVNGTLYQWDSRPEVINVDDRSKVFSCDKYETTIFSSRVRDISALEEVVLELQSHGTPPLVC